MDKTLTTTFKKQPFGKIFTKNQNTYFPPLTINYVGRLAPVKAIDSQGVTSTTFSIGDDRVTLYECEVPLSYFGTINLASFPIALDEYSRLQKCVGKFCAGYALDVLHEGRTGIVVVNKQALIKVFEVEKIEFPFNISDYPDYFVWGTSMCLRHLGSGSDFWCGLFEPWTLNQFIERYDYQYNQILGQKPSVVMRLIKNCQALYPWTNQ